MNRRRAYSTDKYKFGILRLSPIKPVRKQKYQIVINTYFTILLFASIGCRQLTK